MYRLRLSIIVFTISVLLYSCYKPELIPFKKAAKAAKGCNASSFSGVSAAVDGTPFNGFTKVYDAQGQVIEVVAPIFSLVLDDSIRLKVIYFTHQVKFVNAANTSDTVITASFNNQGRLIQMTGSGEFANTDFIYTSNRLSSINLIFDVTVNFEYDSKGNVIRYRSDSGGGLDNAIFTYDLLTKVKDQIYIDNTAGWIYNTFTLAQIMDWTPDLKPRYKRTHATILFDKTDPWYDVEFTDHTFDSQGRLTSYLAGEYRMTQTWNCK
ncbi:MAG TPA: hypothetical protein VLC28_00685 [Flavitalea sp.]|nr:hypothetical protein [Flavitalea sp.]